MNKMFLVLALIMCLTCVFVGAQDYYQCWTDGQGSVNGQNLGGGHYKVSWSGVGDFVCGSGWNNYSGTINWSGGANGAQYFGVYGWKTNPLIEYYIGRGGGSQKGSYSTSRGSYTLYIDNRNGPNIQGNGNFMQYNCNGNSGGPQNMQEHFNGWSSIGASVGSPNYCIVATEGWGGSSGNAEVWVNNSGGGGSTTSSGGGSTTSSGGGGSTTSSGGGGGGNVTYNLRARSTDGQGRVNLRVDSNTIATWTLGSGMNTYNTSSYNSGGINVEFFNDADNRDVQVDYLSVNGDYRQAENQSYNTAVYEDGSCGGDYSEWMHCNGVLGFGDTPGGSSGSSTSTTTSSGGWWWW